MNNWRKILSWQLAYDWVEVDEFGNIFYLNENNQFHNLAGPAIEYANGDREYWVNGEKLTEEEFNIISREKSGL